jgi:hypothetical protein
MRFLWRSLLAGTVLIGLGASISISSPWEGKDDFESATISAGKWKPYDASRVAYQYVYAGQLRCVSNNNEDDHVWAWGPNISQIPSAAKWSISAEAHVPSSAPAGVYVDRAKAGLGIVGLPYSPSKARKLYLKVYQQYSEGYESLLVHSNYAPGNDDYSESYPGQHPNCRFSITHDALLQKDTYQVWDLYTGESLLSVDYPSQLAVTPYVAVAAVIAGKPNWPKDNTTLGMDNWAVTELNPDPINLNPQNSTYKGVAYSVSVTGLDLVNQKLTGTVALTVGSASASLPITGSIDKNGYFALTAKGAVANKGFGCVLLYDVATGTYRPSKNTVTAPKQKAIKF